MDLHVTKRYLGIIWAEHRNMGAFMLSGSERDGKILHCKPLIGFALDYYPEEKRRCERNLGKNIIGDFATRKEAEAAVTVKLQTLAPEMEKRSADPKWKRAWQKARRKSHG